MMRPIFVACYLFVLLLAPLPLLGQEMQCSDCHPDKAENTVVHPAVAMGCDSCHVGTHRGEQPAPKLAVDVPGLCFNCHDQSGFQKAVQHPPAAGGMCLTCHAPHAGPNASLLTAEVQALCTMCHDQQASGKHVLKAFGPNEQHPLQGKPDPSRPGRTISCVSCHHPHASDRERLFRGGGPGGNGICLLCHRKVSVVP